MAAAEAPGALLLLVVGGECGCPELLADVLEELERGVRSWNVEPAVCSVDEELKAFVSRHSATFSSVVKGQRSLHHRGEMLETLVLLNPSDRSLCDELRNLFLDPARHKLLVLAGPCLEDTGELLLQTGGFSARHFLQVLQDREIQEALGSALATDPPELTVSCPTFGDWTQLAPGAPGLQLRLNPAVGLAAGEGLHQLLELVAESLEPPSPFELLEPPAAGGFVRVARPCCYVFPGGLGDAAFFAVNGFTVLVNGGSNPKSSFWQLLRHLERVDAVLVTHTGADSLPGLNSLLRRKLAERDAPGPEPERGRRLLSPALGVVFLGAGPAGRRLRRGRDEAAAARELLQRLDIAPLPLPRGPQPTVLFHKLGVGRLELHGLHPDGGPSCALLVWQPAAPGDKVVRVLFPGRTPPGRLLDALGRLRHLPCLRQPVVTTRDLDAVGDGGDAPKDAPKEAPRRPPARPGLERPAPAAKKDPGPGRPTASRDTRRSGAATAPSRVSTAAPKSRTVANGPRAAPGPERRASGQLPGTATSILSPNVSAPTQPEVSPPPTPPTATTPTLTTPSLPAELGSPHSTELEDSLSLEQPPGEPGLRPRRPTSPHDVDLCLVSPCEFAHRPPVSPGSSDSSARSQCRPPGSRSLPSDTLPTLSDSDPAPPNDSDEDRPPRDPPPAMPRLPGTCMVDPEALRTPSTRPGDSGGRPRRNPARPTSATAARAVPAAAKAKTAAGDRGTRLGSVRPEPRDKAGRASLTRKPSVPKVTPTSAPRGPSGPPSRPTAPATSTPAAPVAPVYLDLAYLPGGGAGLLDPDFFVRVRALCYVISGQGQRREEGLRAALDALLAGKQRWETDLQVTLIPTFDSAAMHGWYEETRGQHRALGITVLGGSMVSMQDEAFPACKVEF